MGGRLRAAALLELERLLRKQVDSGAADLHPRVGEPPVLRVRGDLQRMPDEPSFTHAHLTAIVTAAMPPRNEAEFNERSDTDFAHEIAGLARFPANALKDRHVLVGALRDLETVAVARNRSVACWLESLKGVVSQTLLKGNGGGGVAARQVLLVNPAVSNRIREGKTVQIPTVMQTNKRLGMVTLNDALMDLVTVGEVDPLEAWSKAIDKPASAERLKAKGIDVTALQKQRDAASEG